MRFRVTGLVTILVASASLLTGCGEGDETGGDGLSVVATTTILGDVVSNIVDDDVTVEVLMPIGASPHDFRASSQQAALLVNADLVVVNGLGLEEGLESVLDSAAEDGANVFEIAELLSPLPTSDGETEDDGDHEDEEGHEHGDFDPHVWLDPVRMADAARLIADELDKIDSSIDWAERAEEYASQLLATDEQISELLSSVSERQLVTNHASLGYFADRYDFEVVGVVIPGGSTLADPSSADLAELVAAIETSGTTAIFGDTSEPSAVADAIAAETSTDVEVVELYTGSLGEAGSGADSLVGLLLTNAERIAAALGSG